MDPESGVDHHVGDQLLDGVRDLGASFCDRGRFYASGEAVSGGALQDQAGPARAECGVLGRGGRFPAFPG